jgi:hypothetical protein
MAKSKKKKLSKSKSHYQQIAEFMGWDDGENESEDSAQSKEGGGYRSPLSDYSRESFYSNHYNYGYGDIFSSGLYSRKYRENIEDIVRPEMRWSHENDVEKIPEEIKKSLKMDNETNSKFSVDKFMARDIFKMYYNKEDVIEYKVKSDKLWWHKLLSDTDNYMLKMLTNNSFSNSYIITQAIIAKMLKAMKENGIDKNYFDQQMESANKDLQDQKNNPENPSPAQNTVQQMMKNAIKEGMKDAVQKINDKERMKTITGVDEDSLGSAEGLNMMKSLIEDVKNIRLSKNDLSRFIKKSIKGMKSALCGHSRPKEESFLESDDVLDVPDIHLLNTLELIEDMSIMEDTHTMKFNAYIDCSGSMGGVVLLSRKTNETMKRMTLAKILLYKMKNMNILAEIRGFESDVYNYITPHNNIMSLYANGGTRIDKVIEHIKKNKITSLIVSDGDDTVSQYDSNAYILCLVKPVNFVCEDVLKKYVNNKQIVLYSNGKFSFPYLLNGKISFKEEKEWEKEMVPA